MSTVLGKRVTNLDSPAIPFKKGRVETLAKVPALKDVTNFERKLAAVDEESSLDCGTPTPPPMVHPLLRGMVLEVEGNIGSGKSTLCESLKRRVNADAVAAGECEFASTFAEKVNNAFLTAFYRNSRRYAFSFQMYQLTTRIYQMEEAARQASEENRMTFLDRGAVGDTLFAVQNYKLGNIDDEEFEVYKSVCHERLPETLSDKVDVVLYLDVEPSECFRRMTVLRGRPAEEGVPLDYLEGLDSCYCYLLFNWLGNRNDGLHDLNIGPPPPVIVLSWSNFGTIDDVIKALEDLRAGRRPSPKVQFTVEKPEAKEGVLFIDTEEELQAAYARLKSAGKINNAEGALDQCLALNWDLQHSNAFKRVAMHFLACPQGGSVHFYGPSVTKRVLLPLRSAKPLDLGPSSSIAHVNKPSSS